MADTIYLKTGQFSANSFKTSKNDLKRAVDVLNTLDYYGAMVNAMYTCNGYRHRIFTVAMAEEASSLAILIERLHGKLEAYSKLLQSGPEAIRDVDSSFKGTYTNAWQRGWYSISSGVSSVYNTTVSFWGSLFRKGGIRTGRKTVIDSENSSPIDEEKQESGQQTVTSAYSSKVKTELEGIIENNLGDGPYTYWSWYYGKPSSRTDGWCATFVSYIMARAGIDVDSPTEKVDWFKTYPPAQANYLESVGCYHRIDTGYSPKTGDLVFFDNLNNDRSIDHVGMIYIGDDGVTYVIHGNWGDKVTKSRLYDDYANNSQRLIDCVVGFGDVEKLAQMQS